MSLSTTKKKLIKNLKNQTYCRIKPDSFGGVGVFAIRDIPKGVNPFILGTGVCPIKTVDIPDRYVKQMHPEIQKMITDFYFMENDNWGIPKHGLNANDISFYMNTSKIPNMRIINDLKCSMVIFKTMRDIRAGEELFIDYDEYNS